MNAAASNRAQADGIPRLVELLKTGSAEAKSYAAAAIGNLAVNNDNNKVSIAKAGAIPLLVELLKTGSDEAKTKAAAALANLAGCAKDEVSIAEAGAIPPLVELLETGSAEAKTQAARALGNLAGCAKNKVSIAEAGAIPPLVELLKTGSADAKTNAAAALANLASNNANNKVSISEAGAIPPLVELLKTGRAKAKTTAAGALLRLAVNNANNTVSILKAGADLRSSLTSFFYILIFALSFYCFRESFCFVVICACSLGGYSLVYIFLDFLLMALLFQFLTELVELLATEAFRQLSSIAKFFGIAVADAIRPLVELLKSGSAEAKTMAARALAIFAAARALAILADNKALIAETVTKANRQECCICLIADGDGCRCSTALTSSHFICWPCLRSYVDAASKPGAVQRPVNDEGCVRCPCDCEAVYTITHVAREAADITDEKTKTTSDKILEGLQRIHIDHEVNRARAEQAAETRAELERLAATSNAVARLVQQIADDDLTLKCAKCRCAFETFDGCYALRCANTSCRVQFCGWCLDHWNEDNCHDHVATCSQASAPGYSHPLEVFNKHHSRRKKSKVVARLNGESFGVRNQVLEKMKNALADLNITDSDFRR